MIPASAIVPTRKVGIPPPSPGNTDDAQSKLKVSDNRVNPMAKPKSIPIRLYVQRSILIVRALFRDSSADTDNMSKSVLSYLGAKSESEAIPQTH